MTDYAVTRSHGDDYCVEDTWLSAKPTGVCNVRAALDFCIHRVPWLGGRVKKCVIVLPEYSKVVMLSKELQYYIPAGDMYVSVNIIIDGAGSEIIGLLSGRFLSTVFVDTAHQDFINEKWLGPHSDSQILDGSNSSSFSSFTILNITLTSFGSRHEIQLHGGALKLENLALVKMKNVLIKNCVSDFGGAVYVMNVNTVQMLKVSITSNFAMNGAGIAIINVDEVLFQNSLFAMNEASNIGGALLFESIGNIALMNLNISHNKATNFGGGISFHIIEENVVISNSYIFMNSAKYGSALVLNRCVKSKFEENRFYLNKAFQGGTIYWIAKSNMLEPQIMSSNVFLSNSVGYYGPIVATESYRIVTDTSQLYVSTYEQGVYPLSPEVRLVDFYKQTVTSESNILVEATLLQGNAYCSYNSKTSKIYGGTVAAVVNGIANFKYLGASCIPGGRMNITFSVDVKSFSSNFPVYSSVCKSNGDVICSVNSGIFKVVSTNIPVYFRNCRRGEIFDFNSDSKSTCSECINSYSLADNNDNTVITCTKCPVLAESCRGSKIFLKPGTFRWSSFSSTIYTCELKGGCKGGNTTGLLSCEVGYEGALCSVCSQGYFKKFDRCDPCDGRQNTSSSNLTFYLFLVAIFILIITFIIREFIFKKNKEDSLLISAHTPRRRRSSILRVIIDNKIHDINRIGEDLSEKNKQLSSVFIRARFRILLATYQIILRSPSSFAVILPPLFQSFVGYLSFINLDLGSSIPTHCSSSPLNDLDKMIITTLIPLIGILVLLFVYCLQIIHHFRNISENLEMKKVFAMRLLIKYLKYVFLPLYITLPPISVTILKTFTCTNLDVNNEDPLNETHLLLAEDFTVDCNSSEYMFRYYWAVIMTVIYPIGIPAVFLCMLYKYRHKIALRDVSIDPQDYSFAECIEFLYIGYLPKYWYWEVVEISRRLLLSAAIAVIMKGTSIQIVIAISISLGYTILFKRVRPSKFPEINELMIEGQYQITFTFFFLLVVKQSSLPEIKNSEGIIDISLIIVNVAMIILALYHNWLSWYRTVTTKKETSIKILQAEEIELDDYPVEIQQLNDILHDQNNVLISDGSVRSNDIVIPIDIKTNEEVSKSIIEKLNKKNLDLFTNPADLEIIDEMLINSSDSSIERLLQQIFCCICARELYPSTKYVFYMPVQTSTLIHFYFTRHSETYVSKILDAGRDLESGVIYLGFTFQHANIFNFVSPFERGCNRYLMTIPEDAFIIVNYSKDLQYSRTQFNSDQDRGENNDRALLCFPQDLLQTGEEAELVGDYDIGSISSCSSYDMDLFCVPVDAASNY